MASLVIIKWVEIKGDHYIAYINNEVVFLAKLGNKFICSYFK